MPKHGRIPSSAIGGFIERADVDALLARRVPSEADRRWLVRCLVDTGPAHHRGANYVLLELMAKVLERLPADERDADVEHAVAPVRMRVPPHLRAGGHKKKKGPAHHNAPAHAEEDGVFPLGLPLAPLALLAPEGSEAQAAMIDCLTDGPPQHALANALMVDLLGEMLRRLPAQQAPAAPPTKSKRPPARLAKTKREGSKS